MCLLIMFLTLITQNFSTHKASTYARRIGSCCFNDIDNKISAESDRDNTLGKWPILNEKTMTTVGTTPVSGGLKLATMKRGL